MSDQELIQKLWDTGNFWHGAEALNVKQSQLHTLTLDDAAVQEAVASFQASDVNMVGLSQLYHKRPPHADGDVGPATRQLAMIPRCPIPDHAPPPNASFHYDDPKLQAAVESMQRYAEAGSGSWPAAGCDPERQGVHSIRVRINMAGCPAAVKAYIQESLAAVVKAYAEMGCAVRYILDANSPAEIVKHFEGMSGGIIGWNYFPQAGTCSRITGAFNNSYAPSMQTWANLECHETGHGVGLQHTNGGIMNPSIVTIWPLTWVGDTSHNRMRAFFGGVPIEPPSQEFSWVDVLGG
jgi:hypothetical protein